MSEYMVMYLNKPNDVTRAHRPSRAKYFTQLIFCSLDVNGAATEASAWNGKSLTNKIFETKIHEFS